MTPQERELFEAAVKVLETGEGDLNLLFHLPRACTGTDGFWWLSSKARRRIVARFPLLRGHFHKARTSEYTYKISGHTFYSILHSHYKFSGDYTAWISALSDASAAETP